MGDVGDYWREAREHRKAARRHWIDCEGECGPRFGTPTKVPPGEKCRNCGWPAPGERGSAAREAAGEIAREYLETTTARERRQALQVKRTCSDCGKVFKNMRGRIDHERDKHGKADQRPPGSSSAK